MELKWIQNVAKMAPIGHNNDEILIDFFNSCYYVFGVKMGGLGYQNEPKMYPKWRIVAIQIKANGRPPQSTGLS